MEAVDSIIRYLDQKEPKMELTYDEFEVRMRPLWARQWAEVRRRGAKRCLNRDECP